MPISDFQPQHYEQLLNDKLARVTGLFAGLELPQPRVFPSAPRHYRMRAEFRVWHEGADFDYVMFGGDDRKQRLVVREFPLASEPINRLMPRLRQAISEEPLLKHKLFQVEFLSSLRGEMLVTLIYHKKLRDDWSAVARALATELQIDLVGRSRRQKVVIGRDYIEETLNVSGTDYHYRQQEGAFSQPNAGINCRMLEWAQQQSRNLGGDLLELYCGNGNFTLVLARNFRRVLATEVSKSSVQAARHNLRWNGVHNVDIVRMSSEEVSSALAGERPFRRLQEQGLDPASFDFSTVLVDPPRAGLDPASLKLVSRFRHIVYISCNPQTLAANLGELKRTHTAKHFALFDQFPYTSHMECGVRMDLR